MPLLRSGWRERGFGSKLPKQRRRGSRQECRSYAAVGGRGASAASYRSNENGGRGRNAAPTQRPAGEGLRQQATEATKTGVAAGMPLLRSGWRERGFGSKLPKQRKRGSRQECRSYAAVGGRGASAASCRSNDDGGRGRNAAPTQRLAGEGLRQQATEATTTGVAAGMPLLRSGWRERGFGSKLPKQRRRGSRQECRSYTAVGGRGASAASYRSKERHRPEDGAPTGVSAQRNGRAPAEGRPYERRRQDLGRRQAPAEQKRKRRRQDLGRRQAPAEQKRKRRRQHLGRRQAPAEQKRKRRRSLSPSGRDGGPFGA